MRTMTIDMTPAWIGLLDWLLQATSSENREARDAAHEELRRMARAADIAVEYQKMSKTGSTTCPHCGSEDDTDMHDHEFDGHQVRGYHYCSCGAQWTTVYNLFEITDLDTSDCDGADDMQDIIDDDNRQRAADLNATLRDIGGGL